MLRALLLLTALATPLPACSQAAVPAQADKLRFTGYVVDQAHVLSRGARRRPTEALGRLQRRTGHQFAVVTVAGLGGESVEAFTRRLANRWGVGRRGMDDGVVLLVAPSEHQVRVEVGRGLAPALPDAFCRQLLDRRVIPLLKSDDYDAGVEAGVQAIAARLSADRPAAQARAASNPVLTAKR